MRLCWQAECIYMPLSQGHFDGLPVGCALWARVSSSVLMSHMPPLPPRRTCPLWLSSHRAGHLQRVIAGRRTKGQLLATAMSERGLYTVGFSQPRLRWSSCHLTWSGCRDRRDFQFSSTTTVYRVCFSFSSFQSMRDGKTSF